MKFLVEPTDKTGKQGKGLISTQEKRLDHDRCYYNILNPSNKIQCDQCKRDISRSTKIMINDHDFCCSCFSNLDQYPSEYRVINKLDFPLFQQEWTAEEELLLFEGLEKHGYGNWSQISDVIGTNKSREDVEDHYQHIYLEGTDFLPASNLLSRRDNHGKLIQTTKEASGKRYNKQNQKNTHNSSIHQSRDRASLTVNQASKTGSNPAEIVGFMPRRGDFEVEYDNDAELLLAEMEFNDDDTEEEKAMKYRLMDIYNEKLNERIKRKEFVITRKLLDLKEQMRLDKLRTKQQKDIYNMMKVFSRFNTFEDHEKLVQGIIKQRQIRQRIEELKELKRKGFRTLAQAEDQLQSKRKKEDRIKKKDCQFYANDKSKTRRMRKDPMEKSQKRVLYVNKEEEQLCRQLGLTFKHYALIKETIIRQSIKIGIISVEQTTKMFRIERPTVEAVFNFLVSQNQIITNEEVSL